MVTPIQLTLIDGFYTSGQISAPENGVLRIHLNFSDKRSRVILETSIEPTDGYAVLEDVQIAECVFEKAVSLIEGQVLRIRVIELPSSALCNGTIA